MSDQTKCAACPLVIPLLANEEDLTVFAEASSQPVSLRRKAQFFLDQKLYGRARQMLELLKELGGRDEALRLTLDSLQILEGSLEEARATLDRMADMPRDRASMVLCYAEIERHQHGPQAAIKYLKRHGSEGNRHVLKRIIELQVSDNK